MKRFEQERESLPIFEYKQELIDAIREYSILVVIGETGSGKTTQIPQYILESFPEMKRIGVTQPRRIAAITVARRVSDEQGVDVGTTVGYTIRFDDRTTNDTRLKYMTDGVLLREATIDPRLDQYSVVIIDEAHERTLETDVLFGLLKQTHRLRPDLKILIMSATLDVEKFSDFFEECPIFEIPGRTFPVDIIYHRDAMRLSSLKSNLVDHAIDVTWEIHTKEDEGDVLVFLTGQNDIERACRSLEERVRGLDYHRNVRCQDVKDVAIYPLYASLETFDQKAVFEKPQPGIRKIVFATNVAQTSVTIPGIRYVVDAGFVKEKSFDPSTGMDALLVTEISQAAAIQRAGRAGRTAPGKAYRLYDEASFERMQSSTVPEIQRTSLMGTVLALKNAGVINVVDFEFIDPPDYDHVQNALRHLYILGAIDDDGKITYLGDLMHQFPLPPSLARVLIASAELGCSHEVLTIASILAGENDVFRTPSVRAKGGEEALIRAEECKLRLAHHTGDHLTYLNVWKEWKRNGRSRQWCKDNYINPKTLDLAHHVQNQLIALMERLRLPITHAPRQPSKRGKGDVDPVPILKSFLEGYFTNVANKAHFRSVFSHYAPDEHFSTKAERSGSLVALHLHPQCALSDMLDPHKLRYSEVEWVMYMHVTYTNKAVMKGVSKIVLEWVKNGQGLSRIQTLPKARLNGESPPLTESDGSATEPATERSEPKTQATQASTTTDLPVEEQQKRRAAEIESIRQRALARRKLK